MKARNEEQVNGPQEPGLPRREFLKRAGTVAAGLGVAACAPAATPTPVPTKPPSAATVAPTVEAKAPAATPAPSDAELTAQLYEAAKKEGQAMVYTVGAGRQLLSGLSYWG